MTFNATLNPVVYEGGIPVFIDMSNVIAGVIRDQYNHLTEHISQKKAIYERYKEGLKDLPVQMNPFDEMNAKPNYWLSSLDEIPEAFNIIKGDMSLIGPRPLLVKYLPYYNNEERLRHNVRPGLSGLAQVNGRNAISWEEKFKFDVMYVKKVTFIGDVKIILETVKKAFIKSEGITLNALEDFDEYRKKSSSND